MIYRDLIHNLLRIPDSITELTAYHLLRIHPKRVTPERVDEALRERKRQLRRNIPGPQFIPFVTVVETVLDEAARILSDEKHRRRYNEYLLRKVRRKHDEAARAEVPELDAAEKQAEAVLTAGSSPETSESETFAVAARFFSNAVEMELVGAEPVLSIGSERKLMAMTERVGIDRETARAIIEDRICALGAKRGGPAEETPVLSTALGTGEPENGELHELTEADLAGIPINRDRGAIVIRNVLYGLIAVGVASLVTIIIVLGGMIGTRERERTEPPEETPALVISREDNPLLTELLDAAATPEKVRELLAQADAPSIRVAMTDAARLLVAGNADKVDRVREIVAVVAGSPPARPEVQDALVSGLVAVVRDVAFPTESGRQDLAREPAAQLNALLYLADDIKPLNNLDAFVVRCERDWSASCTRSPENPLGDPERISAAVMDGGYLPMWAHRTDSAGLAAVIGRLALVAADAQDPRSAAATDVLRLYAAYGVLYGRYPEQERRLKLGCRMALVEALRRASNAEAAGRIVAALASALMLPENDPLRTSDVSTAPARAALADVLARRVTTPGVPILGNEVTPGEPGETETAVTPRTLPPAVALKDIRAAFAQAADTRNRLGDVALVLLARADRVARFASKSDAWSADLAAVVAAGPDARIARLTQNVDVAALRLSAPDASAKPPALDVLALAKTARDLDSKHLGVRYRAISRLAGEKGDRSLLPVGPEGAEHKRLLSPFSPAEPLLARLAELVGRTSDIAWPEMNRILRALVEIDNPPRPGQTDIPARLVEMMQAAGNNVVAHRINQTLIEGTGSLAVPLPLVNSAPAREEAARQWTRAIPTRSGRMPWGRKPVTASTPAAEARREAWRPDDDTRKLVALATGCATDSAERLAAYRWNTPATVRRIWADRDVMGAGRLLDALTRSNAQLTRLAAGHERGRVYGARAREILRREEARDALCDADLARAALALRTENELVEALIEEVDTDGKSAPLVRQVRAARASALAHAPDVLVEIREAAFHDVALWDILIDACREREVPVAKATDVEAAKKPPAATPRRERPERDASLDALASGLQAYLERDLVVAGEFLRKAATSESVKRLADGFLLKTLDEMIAECPTRKPEAVEDDAKVCRLCGDTALADCRTCDGSGKVRCQKCGGRGAMRQRAGGGRDVRTIEVSCDACHGSGVVDCETCLDAGTVPCRECTEKAHATDTEPPGPNAIEATRKVICMARYLRAGGLDLYSAGALKPTATMLTP